MSYRDNASKGRRVSIIGLYYMFRSVRLSGHSQPLKISMSPAWIFPTLTSSICLISLSVIFTPLIALPNPQNSGSLFDLNGSVDQTSGIEANEPNSIAFIDNSDWTLLSSQPSLNQDVAGIIDESSSPFIQNGDDPIPPTDSSFTFLQDPDPDPLPIILDSNSNSNNQPLTSQKSDNDNQLLSTSLHDNINKNPNPTTQPISTNLHFDLWNIWPFSCTFKWGSQGVCCDGPEDDLGVRHGCGRTAFNQACDDPSHRFCCALADRTYFTRTWCVAPPPDG